MSVELFSSLNEARALSEGWRQGYKHDRLRCALGMTIPKPVRDRLLGCDQDGRDRARARSGASGGGSPRRRPSPIRSVHGPAVI